jgi:hypothetical protein
MMNDYGQFVDIEKGLRNNNYEKVIYTNGSKTVWRNDYYRENNQWTHNNHVFIDINESSIEEFNDPHTSVHIFPLAITYFWFCIRRMMNV